MDRESLTDEVRNYLRDKRYVVVFDDVWSLHFWDDIEFVVIDNKKGSNILITTRNLDVVVSCKRSYFTERVIRQWIAEGFVKEESGKTLEEIAEGFLIELIHRSLVQSSINKAHHQVFRIPRSWQQNWLRYLGVEFERKNFTLRPFVCETTSELSYSEKINGNDSSSSRSSRSHRRQTRMSDIKVDIPDFEGKLQPDEFADWLQTIE
ncbi:NB-ARC domain disease resistance protein [Medicago truncatula]|uniref:NB-ARC domain disease resistance protein n=1 Tax=Medicago truncatula TaxID=3880 RepID=A0A072UV83_MEDTR|nr:NB-ARC domain disease resistance protein [Medicago truncatula]